MTKDIGNVGRHTWISPNNDKTGEMLVGTLGSMEIMTEDIGNVVRHTWIFAEND